MIENPVREIADVIDIRKNEQPRKAPSSALRRFRQMQYGLFVHYGLYSLLNRHEWAMCYERIPADEYRKLFDQFNPSKLEVKKWVELAQQSGMRYMCLTTRHHEGFALFDSAYSDFTSVRSPLGRDLIREYVDACRSAGLGVGLYYSVADWSDAGFLGGPKAEPAKWANFVRVVHGQLQELMTNYGQIDYLWYDGCPPPETWQAAEINAEIRRLQPQILISDRCGLEEDLISAEQHVISDPGRVWECSLTTNKSWGCNASDSDWKTAREVALCLMTCVHNDGNLLLNVGPSIDGEVPLPARDILASVGAWVRRNEEAIFDTTPHPLNYADQKLSTGRGQTVYVALHFYHGPDSVIGGIGCPVEEVRVLATGEAIVFEQKGEQLRLTGLTTEPADPLLPIVAVRLAEDPRGIPNRMVTMAKY